MVLPEIDHYCRVGTVVYKQVKKTILAVNFLIYHSPLLYCTDKPTYIIASSNLSFYNWHTFHQSHLYHQRKDWHHRCIPCQGQSFLSCCSSTCWEVNDVLHSSHLKDVLDDV